MKLPKIIVLPFCVILLFSCTACFDQFFDNEPAEPELPPITQTGENTFGCLVNGEVMVASNSMRTGVIIPINSNQQIQLSGSDDNESISFIIGDVNGISEKIYILNDSTSEGLNIADYSLENSGGSSGTRYNALNDSGEFEITFLDYDEGIISGLFAFSAVSNQTADTVYITEGRFDIKF